MFYTVFFSVQNREITGISPFLWYFFIIVTNSVAIIILVKKDFDHEKH